jgi:hypothetical protein
MAVLFLPALEGIRCAKIRIVYRSEEIRPKHPIIALQRRKPRKTTEMAQHAGVTGLTRTQTAGIFPFWCAALHFPVNQSVI